MSLVSRDGDGDGDTSGAGKDRVIGYAEVAVSAHDEIVGMLSATGCDGGGVLDAEASLMLEIAPWGENRDRIRSRSRGLNLGANGLTTSR